MLVGYARVSTVEQNLDLQLSALKEVGCEKIYQDQISGTKKNRPGLTMALEVLRKNDTLVVWKPDRLGRTVKGLIDLVNQLHQKEIHFKSINGEIIGGCEGNITGRFCYVHRIWVNQDYREKGLGSKLIYQLENYAKNNNCMTISLDTAEFQAKGFYEKLEYLVISIVDGVIFPGYKQYFMSKNL